MELTKKIGRLALSILLSITSLNLLIYFAPALFPPAVRTAYASITQPDPCQWNGIAKSSVAINITSATTTQLVALVAGKQIFICGFNFTMVGTTQTLGFEYGTNASCAAGTTALTGLMADGTVSDIVVGMYPGSTIMSVPGGDAFCAVTTGTVSAQGLLTYVQQ